MFKGRQYKVAGGYKNWSVRFADCSKRGGVATTAYSYSMTDEERTEMARRIAGALNLVADLSTDQIEAAAKRLAPGAAG